MHACLLEHITSSGQGSCRYSQAHVVVLYIYADNNYFRVERCIPVLRLDEIAVTLIMIFLFLISFSISVKVRSDSPATACPSIAKISSKIVLDNVKTETGLIESGESDS